MFTLQQLLREVEFEVEERAAIQGTSVPAVNMVFARDRNTDRRLYNLPTVDAMSMIFSSSDGALPFYRDFKVYARGPVQSTIQLNILSPHLDQMTYALFLPYGEPGWQPNIPLNLENGTGRRRSQITMLQWKIAQTAVRVNRFNPILYGGKLFQQWTVDSYANGPSE